VASTTHLAELEIEGTDVVAAWNALEPVVAQCAGLLGTPATKSDYHVGHSDDKDTVAGADLRDCLDRVETPTSISVTYTAESNSGPDPQSIELRIMRYRRFKELNVHIGLFRADQKHPGPRDRSLERTVKPCRPPPL
jgi:hypothetical protein